MGRARRERGFTLIELLVVVALIGILATIAAVQLRDSPRRAKEAVLRTNLHTLRDVLDQYYADKQRCAASLQTLVDEGYLRQIPIDPFTESSEAWVTEPCEGEDAGLGYLQDEFSGEPGGLGGPGIWDVHSSSTKTALNGTVYSEW
jgi:general secretion pathway protein G